MSGEGIVGEGLYVFRLGSGWSTMHLMGWTDEVYEKVNDEDGEDKDGEDEQQVLEGEGEYIALIW